MSTRLAHARRLATRSGKVRTNARGPGAVVASLVTAGLLAFGHVAPSAAPAGQSGAAAAQPAARAASNGAKIWLGHEAEFEAFLSSARIVKVSQVPVGVTKPVHAFFEPGGLANGAVFKPLRPGFRDGFYESYKSEIAAYVLDRMLGLGMVPPTVERTYNAEVGSLQLWVENCRLVKTVDPNKAPDINAWNRQVYRQRVWDNLIGNTDRNQGNLLVDGEWHLVLIDHSRAFTGTHTMPFQMTHIDRELYGRMRNLTEAEVQEHLGKLLPDRPKTLIARRDAIVKHFEELVKAKGEGNVLIP